MTGLYEIRADYSRDTIVVYQAYNDAIADAALKAQTFVPPFSFNRMTWIKPSLRWLMHRSNWEQKRAKTVPYACASLAMGGTKPLSAVS